jgi:hypothetical protein
MQTKEFTTVSFHIKGIVTEQSVLDELKSTLNDYAKDGWNAVSVQLIGVLDFLIILEKLV